ncbi:MAG: hypothetical protein HQ582_12120 [Planctomycetes bacterium]|nr:hypothetical protein [Planctomycetota bacterium]
MHTRLLSPALLMLLALFSDVGQAQETEAVKGHWFTQADEALAAAEAARKPVLAVAMDHG